MTPTRPRAFVPVREVSPGRTDRGEQTRELLLATALRLFRDLGYHGATMRRIASEAGVSLGSAYYYFPSKEHLVHAFYAQSHSEHLEACQRVLASERGLEQRLRGVLLAKFATSRDHQEFAGTLFATAADPASPINPFSDDSAPVRHEAIALFAEVVAGARIRVSPLIAQDLPYLLWLYQMGLILFWVHDRSPGQERSVRLVEQTCPIVCRLIQLASLPPLRPLVRRITALLREFASAAATQPRETSAS